jgi:hypothetical protein
MKRFKDIRRLDEAARGIGKVDPEGYYAVYKSGGKMKVAGPYSSEAVATDYHYEDLVDVLTGAELVRSRYKGIQVVKESLGLHEGVGEYSLKKTKVEKKKTEDGTQSTTHYDILKGGKKVGFMEYEDYFGGITGELHGKPLPQTYPGSKDPQAWLHGFLKSGRGKKFVGESVELDEAGGNEKKPGKPETMAQKHFRMMPESFRNRKEWLVYAQEVLKDWKSGDMAMSRLEMVMSVLSGLQNGSNQYYGRNDGTSEQFDPARVDAIARAFKKSIGKMERVGRLGKGSGFNPSMGKITPNEITAYIQAVVDFCKGEWASIDKQYGVK